MPPARLPLLFLALVCSGASGCLLAAAGAGAGGAIYLSDRGAESLVPVSVDRAFELSKQAFDELGVTEGKTTTTVSDGTERRELEGRGDDRDVKVTIRTQGDGAHVGPLGAQVMRHPVAVSSAQGPARAAVMVLGTFHFANPGRDVVKTEVADVLSPARQTDIERVVEALARFGPTKIMVERPPTTADELDSLYRAYRSGRHTLSRNETQQLGFRLGARLDHDRLYPVDHAGDFPFGPMMAYAQGHDTAFVRFVGETLARIEEMANRRQQELSVGGILRAMNDPAELAEGHGVYLRFARVGAGDTFVGADLLAAWYERNIRIFANVRRLTEPGDRVLVLFGAGHAPILRELVAADPGLALVDPLDFLPPE